MWPAIAAVAIQVGSSILGGKAQKKAARKQAAAEEASGKAQKQSNYMAASQMDESAKQQQAIGQSNAAEEIRQSELQQSRALAIAGASGGSASDPDILRIVGDLAKEGRLAAETQMYNGNESARALRAGAKIARWEGDQAEKGAAIQGAATKEQIKAIRLNTVLDIANTAISYKRGKFN